MWKQVCARVMVMATILAFGSFAEAQTQPTGWPEPASSEAKVVKSPVVANSSSKATPAAAPAKPAAAPKARTPKPVTPKAPAAPKIIEVKPVTEATPIAEKAAEPLTAAPAIKPVEEPTTDAPAADVVQLLQQQADLLKKLATDIEAQRDVINAQEEKIKSLEVKSTESAAPAAAAPPPPAITVETSGAKLRVSGLFQGWYIASGGGVVDTFRLRRAELKFAGDISPRIKWTVMVDPAKALSLSTTSGSVDGQSVLTGTTVSQSGRMMQDAFVALNWKPSLSIEVGQQKVPLGIEGTVSSSKLDVVERALYMTDKARGAGYADIRDFGVMLRGKLAGGVVEYSGGVFNGLGEQFNDVDKNENKTMVGRIVARPAFLKGLQVGASMARDHFELSNAASRERQGLELAYARGIFGVKTEYMGGRDAAVTRHGGYAQVSARVSRTFTAVARFDTWDPDTRSEATPTTVTERDWLGGFTYVLHPSGVWLQGNYIRKTFDGLIPSRSVFMTNVQTSW